METSKKITVPFDTLKDWNNNYKQGDQRIIAKRYFESSSGVCIAFKGRATPELIRKINEFYANRKAALVVMKHHSPLFMP